MYDSTGRTGATEVIILISLHKTCIGVYLNSTPELDEI